jgi:hypothetical protein
MHAAAKAANASGWTLDMTPVFHVSRVTGCAGAALLARRTGRVSSRRCADNQWVVGFRAGLTTRINPRILRRNIAGNDRE